MNLGFLDPFGMELHWSTVAKLASIKRMDLIIYYSQMGFERYMGTAYRLSKETAVDLFFGGREWRKIFDKWQGKTVIKRMFIDFYKSKLKELGYTYVFQGNENLGDEPLILNQRSNAKLYRLIFASKNELGYKLWRAIIKRDAYGQRRFI